MTAFDPALLAACARWFPNFVLGTLTLGGTGSGSIMLVNSSSNSTGWTGEEAL